MIYNWLNSNSTLNVTQQVYKFSSTAIIYVLKNNEARRKKKCSVFTIGAEIIIS